MIKVLIADDQELIRESLKIILGAHDNIEIVGVVGNGYEVLETLKKHKVDIILMDIRMPKMDGVYCTKVVKEQYPEIKIVILTTFDDDEYIFSALKYGASGYLLKDVGMEELYEDIMVIYNGGALINPDIATKVVSMFSNMSRNRNLIINVEENCLDELSKNEWKIVQNIGLGLSNKEIAKKMFLSEGTVSTVLDNFATAMNFFSLHDLASVNDPSFSMLTDYHTNGIYWQMIAYCVMAGGNVLGIGTISGLALMKMERMHMGWYFRNIGWKALMGGVIGLAILWLSHILVAGAANLII